MTTWSGLPFMSIRRAKQLARRPDPVARAEAAAMRAESAAFLAELEVIKVRMVQDIEKSRPKR